MNYFCNPDLNAGRKANYKKAEAITAKWIPIPRDKATESLIGNVRPVLSLGDQKFHFKDYKIQSPNKDKGMWEAISSALMLYRLLCLFPAPVKVEPEGRYKCIWWVCLKHIDTGETLMFGEWKGAAGIWTRFHDHKELPKSFKRDTLTLLNLLISDQCPHPYDSLTAGGVA